MTGRPSGRPEAAGRPRRWWPPLLWAAALLTATSWPNPHVPDVREGDKVVHFLMYFGLAALVARAEPRVARRALGAAVAVVALAALAALDEWHQQFIPGRSMSAADWLADTAGAIVALVAAAARRRELA